MNYMRAAASSLLATIVGAGGATTVASAQSATTDPTVVIAEIMFNPAEGAGAIDADDFEFVELHNAGTSTVSLDGMTWTSGIEGSLPDIELLPGMSVIVSPNPTASSSRYGVLPIATYEGKLSNGGETLTLADDDGDIVDSVNYDDKLPWPPAADGAGPSLERVDAFADSNAATNWRASVDGGTPGEAVVIDTSAPTIAVPSIGAASPAADQPVTVKAEVTAVTSAQLVYRVAFGSERTIPMDIVEGVASATIPAQSEGTLVRYRIESGDLSSPPSYDTAPNHGYVVAMPEANSGLPRLQWFMSDADYDQMYNGSRFDRDRLFDAVVEYDGVVYDGVKMQVRGGDYARTNYPKQSFNVEFPDGHLFVAPELFNYPVDEFGLQAEYNEPSRGGAITSWRLFEREGFPAVPFSFVYVNRNGTLDGFFGVVEKLDNTWRKEHGFDDANFYKADGGWDASNGFDQKEGDPADPTLAETRSMLLSPDSPAKRAWLYDNIDIPNVVNYLAITGIIAHSDQRWHNFYVSHDAGGTERIGLYPWDLDFTWTVTILGCRGDDMLTPECMDDPLFDSVWAIPEVRDAYFRRIRSILDSSLTEDLVEVPYDEFVASIGSDVMAAETERWQRPISAQQQASFKQNVAARRALFNGSSLVPASQMSLPDIVISELHHSPAGDGAEFLELTNPTSAAIDISGWRVEGIDLDVPFGTVIPANQTVILTDDDVRFRADHPNLGVIVIEYPGGLKGSGETISLENRSGVEIDAVTYGSDDPWPDEPADGVQTLELADLSLDNALPSAWRASGVAGGTPGTPPSGDVPPPPTTTTQPPTTQPQPTTTVPTGASQGIILRALGTTGTELVEVRNGNEVLAALSLTKTMTEYPISAPAGSLAGLRVVFLNDAYSSSGDRNVQVDWLQVGNQRIQAEDPAMFSDGTWGGGSCDPGRKRSEFLHCNGYFDFGSLVDEVIAPTTTVPPTTQPPTTQVPTTQVPTTQVPTTQVPTTQVPTTQVPTTQVPTSSPVTTTPSSGQILLRASGTTGSEIVEVRDGSRLLATVSLSTSMTQYPIDVPAGVLEGLRVVFVNDAYSSSSDRNVRVDWVEVGSQRIQAEDPAMISLGTWSGNSCDLGRKRSEFLHCNGYFDFGPLIESSVPPTTVPPTTQVPTTQVPTTQVPTTQPPTTADDVVVRARGVTGSERIEIRNGSTLLATLSLSTSMKEYPIAAPAGSLSGLRVVFVNDAYSSTSDRNVEVDWVEVRGQQIQAEDRAMLSTGTWGGGSCSPGLKRSQFLHCNGYFDFGPLVRNLTVEN